MSKTLGNVIGIDEMLEKFGVDGTRYLLMSGGTFGDDLDLTMERMTEKYNNDLANGLGNLVSRVIKLGEKVDIGTMDILKITENDKRYPKIDQSILLIDKFEIDGAIQHIWDLVRGDNRFIEDNKPWELAKSDEEKFNCCRIFP